MPPKPVVFTRSEFFTQYNSLQNQYSFFMMALNASAIAYASGRVLDRTLSWTVVFLGVAVVCWGYSFLCGMVFNQNKKTMLLRELELLDEYDELLGGENINQTILDLKKDALQLNEQSSRYYNTMNIAMLAGMAAFLVWVVVEAFINTKHIG